MSEIILNQAQLDGLLEYSCSLPTGQTIGKQWKKNRNAYQTPHNPVPEWWVGEYVEDPDPKMVGIEWRRVKLMVPYKPGPFTRLMIRCGLYLPPEMVEAI